MGRDSRQIRQRSGGATAYDAPRESRRRRRRYAIRTLVQSCLVTTVIICAYFLLPLSGSFDSGPSLVLALGLLVVTVLLVWQVRRVVQAPYPRVRTIAALVTALPLFLVVFSATYYLSSRSTPDAWSEPLSRLDALYFSVTVFSTVGFGDIVPVSGLARVLTMAQMIGDVVVVGLVVRVMIAAMREGIKRKDSGGVGA
jgi:voltage-gated potassium channel